MQKPQTTSSRVAVVLLVATALTTATLTLSQKRDTEPAPQNGAPIAQQDDGLKKVAISLDHKTYTDTNALRSDSEVILVGLVQDAGTVSQGSSVGMSADGMPIPGIVKTDFSVRVNKLLKGHADATITVVLPGGSIRDTKYVAEGIPWLSQGDSTIMYLVKGEDGKYHPLAGGSAIAIKNSAGKYILPGTVSGERTMEVSEYKF